MYERQALQNFRIRETGKHLKKPDTSKRRYTVFVIITFPVGGGEGWPRGRVSDSMPEDSEFEFQLHGRTAMRSTSIASHYHVRQ